MYPGCLTTPELGLSAANAGLGIFQKLQSGRGDIRPSFGTDTGFHQQVSRTLEAPETTENASILEPIQNPSRPQTPGVTFGDHGQPGPGPGPDCSPSHRTACLHQACLARVWPMTGSGESSRSSFDGPQTGVVTRSRHSTGPAGHDAAVHGGHDLGRIKLITWC